MAIRKMVDLNKIEGEIEVITGLHIGAGNEEIHIGGVDNPVVRDPISGNPYIPGSSLKGKIRCLLELVTGRIEEKATDDPVARIFGSSAGGNENDAGPTRVSFRDCKMINAEEMLQKDALTEDKVEVSINRLTGTAISPRHMERVPREAKFEFEVTYKIFDTDGDDGNTDKENLKLLIIGMRLLENDALGGSGSRGYGRIKFKIKSLPDFLGYDDFDTINIEKEVEPFIKKD